MNNNRIHFNWIKIQNFFRNKKSQYLEIRICEGHGWNELCKFLEKDLQIE